MEDIVIVTGVLVLRPSDEGQGEGITCDGVIQFRNPAGGEVGKNSRNEFFAVCNPSAMEDQKRPQSGIFAVRPPAGRENGPAAETFEIVTSSDEDAMVATGESRE